LDRRKQKLELSINWMHRDVPRRSQVAVYQSAYLLMFHYFGYEFVYHRHSATLREQFEKPEEAICDLHVAAVESASTIEFDRNYAIMIPRAIPVFLARLRLRPKQGTPRVVAVALPGPDNTGLSEVREGDFTGPTIRYNRERLLETPHYMHKLWSYVREGGRARRA